MIKTKGVTSVKFLMSSTLVLPNITKEDAGLYHCYADILSQNHMNFSAKVTVLGENCTENHSKSSVIAELSSRLNCIWFQSFIPEHPYLNLSYRNEHLTTVTVKEGRKKVVFEPRVNSLPPAVVLGW